jgi:beta-glucuronidase
MIFPQNNPYRQRRDLSGFWDFRLDPRDEGLRKGWKGGFGQGRPIAVPSSWNEQFQDTRDFLGPAWYQTKFDLPLGFKGQKNFIRFDSVNYLSEVWLNGVKLGEHEGGHLPFVFEVTLLLKPIDNLLVLRVDGRLAPDRVPPGNVPYDPKDAFFATFYPNASFDFFPYCGIQRTVHLFATPPESITDLIVTTTILGRQGKVRVKVEAKASSRTTARLSLRGYGREIKAEKPLGSGKAEGLLTVPNTKFWAPGAPHLYDLTVELLQDHRALDQVTIPVGIRTIQVKGDKLLLNGKPLQLKGFGRHEDFPVTGRHLPPAVMIKDYELMKWVGANSFRTSHYPYSDEMMDLADRLGFLVITEAPSVGLFFKKEGLKKRLQLCRQYTREMIERDRNHPSVIIWSLADEPHSHRPGVKGFFKELVDLTKQLDKTRPVSVASDIGIKDDSLAYCDVICINRYFGWYSHPGDLDKACEILSKDMDTLHRKFHKPILVTEFGADALPGHHADPPEMFSEEYQAEMISRYIGVLSKKPYVAAAHIWVLCDFKTAQATHRPGAINWKGVFTRDRRPKLAAHTLRKLWK